MTDKILNKASVYAFLDKHEFEYEVYAHHAAFTIEEIDAMEIPNKDNIVKNLFLRDDKKRNYYLVTLPGHKTVNLKSLGEMIPSRKLSFADEDRLFEMLMLKKGHVTPLAILNNDEKNVIVVFDRELKGKKIGIHPMENDATVFIAFDDVLRLVEEHGNPVVICDIG